MFNFEPAIHKDKCLYSYYICLYCFLCKEKGVVNV